MIRARLPIQDIPVSLTVCGSITNLAARWQQPSSRYTFQRRRNMSQHYHSCAQQDVGRRASAALTPHVQYECKRQPGTRHTPHHPGSCAGAGAATSHPSTRGQGILQRADKQRRNRHHRASSKSECLPAAGSRRAYGTRRPCSSCSAKGISASQTPPN